MKKILICLCFLGIIFAPAQTAQASKNTADAISEPLREDTIKRTNIWVATPWEFDGEVDIYLHSEEFPDGIRLSKQPKNFFHGEWRVQRYILSSLEAGEYWMTLFVSDEDYIGVAYPDMNEKSLTPDIDLTVTSRVLLGDFTGTIQVGDMTRYYPKEHNTPQFFCLVSPKEDIETNKKDIESIFIKAIQAEGQWSLDNNYAIDQYLFPSDPSSHYDDYINFYQPFGYSVYKYLSWNVNHGMNILFREDRQWSFFDTIGFSNPTEFRYSLFNFPAVVAAKAGWEIVCDTRNVTIHTSDTEDVFMIGEDDSRINIFIRNLGDEAPPMPTVGGIDFNNVEVLIKIAEDEDFDFTKVSQYFEEEPLIPTENPDDIITDNSQNKDEDSKDGETTYNTVPTKKKNNNQTKSEEILEESDTTLSPAFVVVPIVGLLLIVGIIIFFIRKVSLSRKNK